MNKRAESRNLTVRDLNCIKNRLDSQSRRIEKMHSKLAQIVENQRYYINKRLPGILERAKVRGTFTNEYKRVKEILSTFGKENFIIVSNSKNGNLKKQRYIGMFTHVEMQRLRRFLEKDRRMFREDVKILDKAEKCDIIIS